MDIINTGKSSKTRKAIGFLLSVLMVFSLLTVEIPSAYAENEPLPTETDLPTDEPQTSEEPQQTEYPQPTETVQPTDEPKPSEEPQSTEEPQPTETPQVTEEPQVSGLEPEVTQSPGKYNVGDFHTKTSAKPDKGLLSTIEKKLSTKILQLTNDEYLPFNITRGELISQMAAQNQIKQGKAASGVPGSSGTSVHVYIQTKKGSNLKALSKYAKIEDTDTKNGLASAWVDVSMIKGLASVSSVKSIREVIPPVVRMGSALSEGDSMLNADDVRATIGADGTGIKVGIISDGVDHLASAVASGDLPSGSNAVHVLSNTVGGDEGTAILEIVHDLAPGAQLYFHDCGDNTIAFNNAITELAQAGCDIICDDIGWLAEPFFEDGSIAQHVADVMSTYGLIYVSSAGNAAKNHYQGLFVDLGNDDLFGDGCPTANFSGNGSDPFLYVQVPKYSSMIVVMEWNDPFGNSSNDYDLEIYDTDSGDYLDGSYYWQEGSGSDPVEFIIYSNENSSAQDILIRACKYYDSETQTLAADKTLEIYTYGCYTYPTNTVAADSIFGHPAVPGVLSCGAIDGNSGDGADYGLIEDFSSQGPVTMISGTRQKPDICGIDGVSVTGAGGFPNPFYGTSAAAPHIAAITALLESAFPTESSSNIRQMIVDNSVDLGSSGYDNVYGYGRADALAAVQRASCIVSFDSRGGSDVAPQRVIKGRKVNKPSNPSKTEWFFGGWYKEQECINTWDFANDTVTSDTTLYAKWKDSRDIYTISEDGTYDVSDYGDFSQVIIDPGLTVTLTNNSVSALDIQIACGEGVSLTINNLIIQCLNESALSFIGAGNSLILIGENSLKSGLNKPGIKVEEGTALAISGDGCVLSVSGSNAAGIGGGSGSNGGSIAVNGGTVYAWGIDSPFDIGGGAGGTGGALSISGDSAVLLANGTSAAPVTSTHELFTTNVVKDNIVFGKVELAAGWPKPVYAYLNSNAIGTLTYNGNGGTGTIPEAVVQYNGTSTPVSSGSGLSKDGYSVASWNTQADGLGTGYAPGKAYTFSGDITLYAVYAAFPVTEHNAFDDLGFIPMDSAMDPDRDVVYMTESGGCRLYRVDLNTGKIGYIEFPYKAERLTVKNGKVYVTLPQHQHTYYLGSDGYGSVGVVDAAAFTIQKIFDVVPDPYDIEADDEGRVYIGSGSDQWSILTVYDTETEQRIDTVGLYRYQSLLDFNPVYNKLYSIDTDSSPRDITAYEITDGNITKDYDSPYHGDYAMSVYMKISPDGQYIFNGSGNVFTSAPTQTGDMVYAGNIGLTFSSICFDQSNNEFIISNTDGMYICDYDTWEVKAAQGSEDSYKGVYCNSSHFVSLMGTSAGKYYLVLDNKTPGLDVTGVTLNLNDVTVVAGGTDTLTAAISPKYATNQNVTWSSNNESVATVSNGVITAVGLGNAVITARTEDGGFTDTCNVTIIPNDAYNQLGFTPLDSAIDPDRDVVYMTAMDGKLVRIDLGTGKMEYIRFPYKAERLTVKNDRVYVTLPHGKHNPYDFSNGSGSIAIVDADTFTVDKIFGVVPDPYDIEVDGEGRAYIGSGSGQWSILTVYDTETEQQIDTFGSYRQMSLLDYNPAYDKLYSITTDSSPRDIKAYEITNGDITTSYDSPYHGDYSMSTYMKVSPDGQYIFNGSGNVFTCAPAKTGDMVYAGSLGLTFNSICFDLSNNEFIFANDNGMYICDYDTWTVKAAQGSKDLYKGVYCNSNHFVSMMKTSAGKYYLVLDNKTPGLDVTGVTLSPESIVIMDDETETLTATISPKYATNQNMTWSSSNESVVTVSNGIMTPTGGGSAVITVTTEQGGFKDTCNVTVIPYMEYDAYDELWFTPMDTAIDPSRDVVYMTETGGNKLYRIDFATGEIEYIKFPYKAERLTVRNDKVYVTLPHGKHDYYDFSDGSGSIAVIDAATFSVDKIFDVVPDPYDIEVDDAGRVFIGSGSGQWSSLTVYDTETEQQIDSVDLYNDRSLLDFNPVHNKLYSVTTDSSPRDITAYEITNGDITARYDSPYHGDYNMSTYMKISPDGQYIFNGSGNVFTSAPTRTGDMVYAGSLGHPFNSICFDLPNDRFYTSNGKTITSYTYSNLTALRTLTSANDFITLWADASKITALMKNAGGKYYIKEAAPDTLLYSLSINSTPISGFDSMSQEVNITIPTTEESVTISASAFDSSGQISGDIGVQPMPYGNNTYTVTVTGTLTGSSRTYTLHVNHIVPGNAYLSGINTSAGTLSPAFGKDTLNYSLNLSETTSSVTITPVKDDSHATLKINGSLASSKTVSLQNGASVDITMEVTASDGYTKKVYVIHVTRAPSKDARLYSLSLSSGTMSPSFNREITEYSAALASTVSSVTVSATTQSSSFSTIRIDGAVTNSKTYTLTAGETRDAVVLVTAQDGTTTKTYTVHISRAASNNANLSGISLSNGTLSPSFSANTIEYNVALPSTVSSTTITPLKSDSAATLKIDGAAASNKTVTLSLGETKDVILEVTAQNGTVTKTYTVHFIRTVSHNADLSGISLAHGTLSPSFSANTVEYSVALPNTVSGTAITPFKADSTATLRIDGNIATSKVVSPAIGQTVDVVISVTAQDGTTTKTYTLHVSRAYSNNANLSGFSYTNGMMSPSFSANTIEYNLALPNTVSGTTITPYKADSTATLRIDGNTATSKTVSLATGQTIDVVILVTAQNSTTTKTYTVHVSRAASNDASLSGISISSGTLSPSFNANTYEYDITLSNTVTGTTITPLKTDSTAAMKIDGVTQSNKILTLSAGETKYVNIEVTAQDGETKKTYTLHITREAVMVTGVELNKTALELTVGNSSVINCNVIPANATNKNVTWASDRTGVATVSGGKITAVGVGSAVITVRTVDGGFMDTCTVTVTPRKYSITVYSNNNTYGTVKGGGTYNAGVPVTLTASPKTGYVFYRWTESGSVVSTSAVYTFTATGNRNITAVFGTVAAPVSLTAASASYSSIKISWSKVNEASGYLLYRSKSENGVYSLIKTTTSLSYINTNLNTGTKYYYKVRAYKSSTSKAGNFSAVASAKPTLKAITSIKAAVYYPTSIEVSWSTVAGRTGYEVWRSRSADGTYALIKSTGSTSYKNTGLIPSVTGSPVTYYYKVRAYRTVSGKRVYGDFSAVKSATPTFADVSSASALAYSPTGVKISWSKVSGRSGYEVWRSKSADGTYTLVKTTTDTSYKNTNLTPFVTYYYKVRAYVKLGSMKVYSSFTAITSATPAFSDVAGVKAMRSSSSKIKISWSKVLNCSGYEVWRSSSADGEYTLIKSTTSNSFTNTKLTTGVTYYYKVRAYVKVNDVRVYSKLSDVVFATP